MLLRCATNPSPSLPLYLTLATQQTPSFLGPAPGGGNHRCGGEEEGRQDVLSGAKYLNARILPTL